MRTLSDLRDVPDPGIDRIREWVDAAVRPVELLLPAASTDDIVLRLQVTRRSTLGALAADTGGILVDHGWLRHLGGGSTRITRDLASWNQLGATPRAPGAMLVADDVLGGFFAINGGGLVGDPGSMCYLAPDALRWEPMDLGHTDFVAWTLTGALDRFYADQRWDGWAAEIAAIPGDSGLSIYPFLWAEGPPIGERARGVVSIDELWRLWHKLANSGV